MKEIAYIGLDISTSIVGVSFFCKEKKVVSLYNINLKKLDNLFYKADLVKKFFLEKQNLYKFENLNKIYIEEALQSFSRGQSSARTLHQLSAFNGIVSNIVYNIFNKIPLFVNVNKARKVLGIQIDKTLKENTKQQVFNWVRDNIENDQIIWPSKPQKRGEMKGQMKFDDCCYDMSDAYVICKAPLLNESCIS